MNVSVPETEASSTRPAKPKRRNRKRVAAVFGCTAVIAAAAPVAAAQADSVFNASVFAHQYRSHVQICGTDASTGDWACTSKKDMDHVGTLYWAGFPSNVWDYGNYMKLWWNHHGTGSWNFCYPEPSADHSNVRASLSRCSP